MTGPILQALFNPSEGKNFRSILVRSVIYPVVLLLLLTGIFLWQLESVLMTTGHVEHSNGVITQASVVLKQMVDMETGLRGYLLTQDAAFLEPYHQALTTFDGNFTRLRVLCADNAEQLNRLDVIQANIEDWQQFATDTLDAGSETAPVDVAAQLDGKQQMDTIRAGIAGFVTIEEQARGAAIDQSRTTSEIVIVSTILGGLLVGGLLAFGIRQQLLRLAQSYEQIMGVARKQAEDILTQGEWLRGVLSSIGDAVIATDIPGNITFINPVTEALTGWSAADATGKPLAEVYQIVRDGAPETSPKLTVSAGESRLIGRNGSAIAIDDTVTPIMSVHGEPLGTVVVFRDVTRRQMIERERLHMMDTQTRYASMLRHSNEQLEQFAYVASHDLQEPLRMVVSYLQLLESRYGGALNAEAREFIDYAVGGATRMKALITGLLQYARLDDEQDIVEITDLANVLKQVLSNLEVLIAESSATISADALPEIQADSLQMLQLFQNLIGNAIKFRSERPLTIHIGAVKMDGHCQFSVRDNGIGIAPEFQKRIFRLFQRLHTREEYAGTGIGLATCKKIVERHHGRIWIEATEGGGVTFFFTLPVKHETLPPILDT